MEIWKKMSVGVFFWTQCIIQNICNVHTTQYLPVGRIGGTNSRWSHTDNERWKKLKGCSKIKYFKIMFERTDWWWIADIQWYSIPDLWLIEHGFTSAPTQYRLYGRQFLQVWWPNQQCQSTEGGRLVIQTGLNLTMLTSPCYNTTTCMQLLHK